MAKKLVSAAVAAFVLGISPAALAEDGERAPAEEKPSFKPDPPSKATDWYGWQTLAIDTIAVGTMIAAVSASDDAFEGAASLLLPTRLLDEPPKSSPAINGSLALYTLGPAFVHALHGRGAQAVASPSIRALAPTVGTVAGAVYGLAGAAIVAALDDSPSSSGFNSPAMGVLGAGILSGYLAGFIVPIVVDAAVFGHEPVETGDKKTKETKVDAAKVTWSPRVGMSKGGPTVGLSGTF